MTRMLHRWPGLLALALLLVLSLSGAALSVFPALEKLTAPQAGAGMSVADLATRIQAAHPGVEQIKRAPSGRITAYWFSDGQPGGGVIDPATGAAVAAPDRNPVKRWLTNLHRSLFLDDAGRWIMAAGAAAMLVMALSGAVLVARRLGGWRHWCAPVRGALRGRVHVEVARIAVAGLLLSSMTALWMTASTFDLLPDGAPLPAFPAQVSGGMDVALADMAALRDTPVSALRSLSFPYAGDPGDVFTLETGSGTGYVDQGTGEMLVREPLPFRARLSETIYMLHTGQGAALLGVILGLVAVPVPVLGLTGALIWWAGRRGRPRMAGTVAPGRAETVVLVGSEGGSTWGFAATLTRALTDAGQAVHVAPMSDFAPERHGRADRIIVLAATYGDGAAPASARGFLDRLLKLDTPPKAALAVLGFGDRGFPQFCAHARAVAAAAQAKGWPQLVAMDTVDRQAPQDFARWGRNLGAVMGLDLELAHQPVRPATHALTLISRRDYGGAVQAPTAILRFARPWVPLWQRMTGRGFGRFAAGDLLGVLPEGADLPRLYSLASGTRDGFVEVVVRKQPGGLCSGQLMALRPGDSVQAFLRHNPDFKPGRGVAPLILIGAGTGVGPLAGFIRANARRRPVHLFFGMRHMDSDFLYSEEIAAWQAGGQIDHVFVVTSRAGRPHYVQDALRAEAGQVAHALRHGARVMVCGGRDMAAGVSQALEDILAPMGLTPAMLKAEGRYVEDVY